MEEPEGAYQGQGEATRLRPDQALRQAEEPTGLRVPAGQLPATRTGGELHLRGHARPAEGHAGREARPGEAHADGSPGLRRCRLRQDGGGDPCRVQGRVRQQAGGRLGAHHDPCAAAREELPGPHEGPAGARGLHQPLPQHRRTEADPGRPEGWEDRHHHRHAPAGEQGRGVQGPRPADHRRGAEVRREREGQVEDPARHGRHADAHRHADPAHACSSASWARATSASSARRRPTGTR